MGQRLCFLLWRHGPVTGGHRYDDRDSAVARRGGFRDISGNTRLHDMLEAEPGDLRQLKAALVSSTNPLTSNNSHGAAVGERFSPIRFSLNGADPEIEVSRPGPCVAPFSEKRSS
jgi:hypothetical protein